jgi:type IV fimbrial biogenesis protein FimT
MNAVSKMTGVTLIELMIAIALVSLLLLLGVPSYTQWIHNTQIRTATEAALNGIQTARAEAIRRNTNVEVVFNALPSSSWSVNIAGGETLQSRSGADGSASASVALLPAGATRITFSGLGRIVDPNPADGSVPLTQLDVTSTAAAANRPLRVAVGVGGNVRMCDPAVSDASDPRKC